MCNVKARGKPVMQPRKRVELKRLSKRKERKREREREKKGEKAEKKGR